MSIFFKILSAGFVIIAALTLLESGSMAPENILQQIYGLMLGMAALLSIIIALLCYQVSRPMNVTMNFGSTQQ